MRCSTDLGFWKDLGLWKEIRSDLRRLSRVLEGIGEESGWILMEVEYEFRRNLGLGIAIWFWIADFVTFVVRFGKDAGFEI